VDKVGHKYGKNIWDQVQLILDENSAGIRELRGRVQSLELHRMGAKEWEGPFQGLREMVVQMSNAIATITPHLAQFQECLLGEKRKIMNEQCEALRSEVQVGLDAARREMREQYLAGQQSVANTLRQVQILQECLQSSAVGEHMARVQTAQVAQSAAEQVARMEQELLQARQSPVQAAPSADEVARKLQENMHAAQKLQDAFTHARQGGVPSAIPPGAQKESGSAILLDPLEGEGDEDDNPISQSALMYMPSHLIPQHLKEGNGNLRKIRAIGSGGGTTIMPLHGDLISMEIAKGTKAPFFDPQTDAWEDFEIDWEIHWDKISQGKSAPTRLSCRRLSHVWPRNCEMRCGF